MSIDAYLRHRHWFEALLVLTLLGISFLSNVGVELIDYGRQERPRPDLLAWLLEGSSHAALLLVFPALLWFDERFPLRFSTWRRSLPAHLAFSVVFSALHVGVMIAIRKLSFPVLLGYPYRWDNVAAEFAYEYLKDFRTYLLLLSLVYLYRFILLRLQGEAGLLDDDSESRSERSAERFIVKKLGREFLVRTEDIEWIESAGNYVNFHVGDKKYPLRGTMVQIAERLAGQGFIRVHRQAIVNASRIAEFQSYESGDGELRLTTDAVVPVSRRYRRELKQHMQGAALIA